jgi:NADH-quinone oxidoreductase subunit H
MVGVAYMTLMERKVSAWMQNRRGPNRIGYAGLLQPVADGIKNLIKEETLPGHANRALFFLAPCLAFVPALLMSSVIPWASPLPLRFDVELPVIGRIAHDGTTPFAVMDLPVGFLYVLGIASLGVYGIALAGWASNSKYSLLGGLRAAGQMVSYEVAMGLSLIPVLLLGSNVAFASLIASQQEGTWFVLPLFLAFFLFLVAGFAETNRAPFDMPEAESELVAGYHTEYSAFKFSMFFIAEYANIMTFCAMTSVLFLGGWDIPFVHWDETPGVAQSIVTGLAMFLKTSALIFVVMWVRWTLPRFRYDQLMALGWKFMLPVALTYIIVVTLALYVFEHLLGITSPRALMGALAGVSAACAFVVFVIMDRGSLIRGSGVRAGGLTRAALAPRPAGVRMEG